MTLNDKMVRYLNEQIVKQELAEGKLFYAISCSDRELPPAAAIFHLVTEVTRHNRYIRHALQEAWDCEDCKENGLIATYPYESFTSEDFLPEPE